MPAEAWPAFTILGEKNAQLYQWGDWIKCHCYRFWTHEEEEEYFPLSVYSSSHRPLTHRLGSDLHLTRGLYFDLDLSWKIDVYLWTNWILPVLVQALFCGTTWFHISSSLILVFLNDFWTHFVTEWKVFDLMTSSRICKLKWHKRFFDVNVLFLPPREVIPTLLTSELSDFVSFPVKACASRRGSCSPQLFVYVNIWK